MGHRKRFQAVGFNAQRNFLCKLMVAKGRGECYARPSRAADIRDKGHVLIKRHSFAHN